MKTKYPYQVLFSQRLRFHRNENRLSVAALATRLSVPRSTVGKWLAGTNAPDRPRLLAVCKVLELDVHQFIHDVTAGGSDCGRERFFLTQTLKLHAQALAADDATALADAMLMAGMTVFLGLRRRGVAGRLQAEDNGLVKVHLCAADMSWLWVQIAHDDAPSAPHLFMQVHYSMAAPALNLTVAFSEVGLNLLVSGLRDSAVRYRAIVRQAS